MITRRTFVAAAATLVAAPRVAWAQEMRRIAIVNAVRPLELLRAYPAVSEFRQELERRGYAEGKNLVIDYTSGAGREDQIEYLREVVASKPEVIFVMSGRKSALDLMRITETIPIVTGHPDPVAAGLVTNLARPGGNVTGFVSSAPGVEGKRLQLLVEAVPSATRFGYLVPRWAWAVDAPAITDAAATLGITLVPYILEPPIDEQSYHRVFAAMANDGMEAVFAGRAGENSVNRELIARLALEARLPATGHIADFAHRGGLIAYAADRMARYRGSAGYVARILDGENPGELPFQLPLHYNLVVNLKTAKAIGVTLPNEFLLRATEVIE